MGYEICDWNKFQKYSIIIISPTIIYERSSLGLNLSKYMLEDRIRPLLGALTLTLLHHHGHLWEVDQLPFYLILGPFFLQVCFFYVRLVTHHITIMRKAKYRRVILSVWVWDIGLCTKSLPCAGVLDCFTACGWFHVLARRLALVGCCCNHGGYAQLVT
jgi:hypothetical protein